MPRVKLDYVVSFSSEDPENPASSLLATEVSRRKWLGDKGSTSHSVVLQLAKCARIHSVTVGGHHSALVEVLVGRSEKPHEPFKVLVLSSVFMTPSESKKSENVSKVRTFQHDQLAADTRDQSWDRVRVVCLQPYNKHVKYGLSFIHIFEPEGAARAASPSPSPGTQTLSPLPSSQRFQITANSSDEEDMFKPGELFQKIRGSSQLSVDAQIRQASKPSALKNSTESPARLCKAKLTAATTTGAKTTVPDVPDDQERVSRDKESLLYKDEEKPNDKIDKIMQRDREEKEKNRDDEKSHADRKRHRNDEERHRNKENDSGRSSTNEERSRDKERKHNDTSKHVRHDSKDSNRHDRKESNRHDRKDSNRHDSKDSSRHESKDSHQHRNSHKAVKPSSSDDRPDSTLKSKEKERSDRESSTNKDTHSHGRDKDRDRNSRHDSDRQKDRDKNGESSSSRHSSKRAHSRDKNSHQPSKRLKRGPRSTSPHRLMAGVVLVLSGYQNPRRAKLRDKALAMGARYRQDWGPDCTHLICAFDNTPKLRQVRSSDDRAVIVKGEWVEECCAERRLLPWQWFATESEHRVARVDCESDSEPEPAQTQPTVHDSDCDTDDEIQKVIDQQMAKPDPKSPDKPKGQNSPTERAKSREDEPEETINSSQGSDVAFVCDERIKANISISSSDTDSYTDEDTVADTGENKIEKARSLPEFFDGFTFTVDPDLDALGLDCDLLKRYITAYSGELVKHIEEDTNIDYILSMNPVCKVRKLIKKSAPIVRPDWIWRCHEKMKKLSSKDFYIK